VLSHITTLVMAMKMVYETLVNLNQLMQLARWDPIEFSKCKSFILPAHYWQKLSLKYLFNHS